MERSSCHGLDATAPGSGFIVTSLAGIFSGIADLIDRWPPSFRRERVNLSTKRVNRILPGTDDSGEHDNDHDNDDRSDDIWKHLRRLHGTRVGDVMGAGSPVGAACPDLMLPDWCRLFKCVDRITSCLERFGAVRRRHDHNHG